MPDFNRMANLRASPSPEDLRREIVAAVENGEISPEDAEQKAREMGLGGFSRYPELNTLSAMELDVWSLDMALAWIIWRSREKVEEYWLDSDAFGWGWKAIWQRPQIPAFGRMPIQTLSGYRLVPSRPISIFSESRPNPLIFFSERKTPQAQERMDRTSAERALRSALIQSELIATARRCSNQAIMDIPSREWSRFQYDASAETELFIPLARLYEPEEVENLYREVTVLKSDVVRLWSESGSDYLTGDLVENTREDRYREWLLTKPNAQQVVGRFLLEVWDLDIKPITDGSRYNQVSAFAKTLGASPPSAKTISRFLESAKAWLLVNG